MIKEIQCFCKVADLGGLAKAARALNVSTPMMTRHINKLEKELGVRLFQRTTRHISLTAAGEHFYTHAEAIIEHYQSGKKTINSLTSQATGHLKIGLPTSISQLWLTPALKKFYMRHPDVNVSLLNGNYLLNMLSDGFDFVIHCGELPDGNYYAKKIKDWRKLVCATPEYWQQYGIPQKPEELSAHNCLDHFCNYTHPDYYVCSEQNYSALERSWPMQINNKLCKIPINGNTKADSSMALRKLALSGLGVVNLPDFVVADCLRDGHLQVVLKDYQPAPLGMYLVYTSQSRMSYTMQIMMEFILDVLQTELMRR